MPPGGAQPLHAAAVGRVAGDRRQDVEHVVRPHLPQAVQQTAGVVEHHAGVLALVDEFGDELAHPFVAAQEDRGVVAVHLRVFSMY